jgi:predicted RNase H-like nuclease (RuvC/YqgF family)
VEKKPYQVGYRLGESHAEKLRQAFERTEKLRSTHELARKQLEEWLDDSERVSQRKALIELEQTVRKQGERVDALKLGIEALKLEIQRLDKNVTKLIQLATRQ